MSEQANLEHCFLHHLHPEDLHQLHPEDLHQLHPEDLHQLHPEDFHSPICQLYWHLLAPGQNSNASMMVCSCSTRYPRVILPSEGPVMGLTLRSIVGGAEGVVLVAKEAEVKRNVEVEQTNVGEGEYGRMKDEEEEEREEEYMRRLLGGLLDEVYETEGEYEDDSTPDEPPGLCRSNTHSPSDSAPNSEGPDAIEVEVEVSIVEDFPKLATPTLGNSNPLRRHHSDPIRSPNPIQKTKNWAEVVRGRGQVRVSTQEVVAFKERAQLGRDSIVPDVGELQPAAREVEQWEQVRGGKNNKNNKKGKGKKGWRCKKEVEEEGAERKGNSKKKSMIVEWRERVVAGGTDSVVLVP